mmetsp:Transcript_6301/g.13834  ORF Transcript_6301/g.13834 Transcript_6301/m.13834 type:complete len:494 (+) Transcript_6301:104-1585(+)
MHHRFCNLIGVVCILSAASRRTTGVAAFSPTSIHVGLHYPHSSSACRVNEEKRHSRHRIIIGRQSNTVLSMSSNFDLTRPTFDLFTLRSIRGDALLQYNSLNQSEPLRINLFLTLTFTLLALPSMSEAVLGEALSVPGTAASLIGSVGSFALFLRECSRRSRQLERIEKEMNAEFLMVRLPNNRFAERRFGQRVQLKQLRGKKRVIALCGTKDELRHAMVQIRAFRNRLYQAAAIVVPIPTDGSSAIDWGLSNEEMMSTQFLAEADNIGDWVEYFRALKQGDDESSGSNNSALFWFGLSNSGRSFASGAGDPPRLIEILGQNLRPVEVLLETDEKVQSTAENEKVFAAQEKFYAALTSGDHTSMESVFTKDQAEEVSEVIEGGGRIDKWKACLEDGARPEGMLISGGDCLIASPEIAYSTAVEFPPNAGIDSATLLAVQRWAKQGDEWKLLLHQTIPWSPDSKAGGTLRCDCRGCVALTRAKDRRTFGGIVGR